jgi:carbonic anhydrase
MELKHYGKFATAISCIDGRVQPPILDWVKKSYFVDFVDAITEPGANKTLSEKNIDKIRQLKSKVLISINAHGSKLVVISGHYDCAANIASKELHMVQIQKSINVVKSWKLPIMVIGIWINDKWEIEEIHHR